MINLVLLGIFSDFAVLIQKLQFLRVKLQNWGLFFEKICLRQGGGTSPTPHICSLWIILTLEGQVSDLI